MPSQEEINAELARNALGSESDDDRVINSKGILIPDVPFLRQGVAMGKQFVHGFTGDLDEKVAAGLDTLGGVGEGEYLKDFGSRYRQNEARALARAKQDSDLAGLPGQGAYLLGAIKNPVGKQLTGFLKASGAVDTIKAGKGLVNLALNAGKGAVAGAASGAIGSGMSHLGTTANEDLNMQNVQDALASGAKWGAGLGAAGGALGSILEHYRPTNEVKAALGTAGEITRSGKAANIQNQTKQIDKARKVAAFGHERGVTGQQIGQGITSTVEGARAKSAQIGGELENARNQISAIAQRTNQNNVGWAGMARNSIANRAIAKLQGGGKKAILPEHEKALGEAMHELSALGDDFDTVSFDKLQSVYRSIKDMNHGQGGIKAIGDNVKSNVFNAVESAIKDFYDTHAFRVDKKIATEIGKLKGDYHMMQTLEDMAAASLRGELGQREGGGLLSSIRGGMAALLSGMGVPGRLAVYEVGTKASQRGVMPNTWLYLGDNPQIHARNARIIGQYLGRNRVSGNQSTMEDY